MNIFDINTMDIIDISYDLIKGIYESPYSWDSYEYGAYLIGNELNTFIHYKAHGMDSVVYNKEYDKIYYFDDVIEYEDEIDYMEHIMESIKNIITEKYEELEEELEEPRYMLLSDLSKAEGFIREIYTYIREEIEECGLEDLDYLVQFLYKDGFLHVNYEKDRQEIANQGSQFIFDYEDGLELKDLVYIIDNGEK